MKRLTWLAAALVPALAVAAFGQDKAPGAKLIGVEELAVAADAEIPIDSARVLTVVPGAAKGTFYIVVKLSREIPEGASPGAASLDVKLTSPAGASLAPYAVAPLKKEIEPGKTSYLASEKKRWAGETWYFPAAPGQRDWTVTVGGVTLGRMSDYYATLIVRNADAVSTRLKLPDGSMPVVEAWQAAKLQFPAGPVDLALEVKGHGKISLPWKKFDRGEVRIVVVAGDVRVGPVLPGESLRTVLPRMYRAWQIYHKMRGLGGGTYNIGAADKPIHINVDFGAGDIAGGLTHMDLNDIAAEFVPDETPSKHRSTKEGPRVSRYSNIWNQGWRVEPWDKVEFPDITEDAHKIVGQVVVNSFVFRSVESNPSQWAPDGMLIKGILYDKALGYFLVEVKKESDAVVVFGAQTKEP